MRKRQFKLTSDHVKLLRAAYVSWDGCEFGAPAIDCKRPYGNSDPYPDIAKIIGIEPGEDDWEPFTQDQFDYMRKKHEELETALQIVLATGAFEPGIYEANAYSRNWQLLSEDK